MPFQAFVIREASQDVESPAKDVQPQMCGLEGMERAPNCLRIKGQTHLRPRHRLTDHLTGLDRWTNVRASNRTIPGRSAQPPWCVARPPKLVDVVGAFTWLAHAAGAARGSGAESSDESSFLLSLVDEPTGAQKGAIFLHEVRSVANAISSRRSKCMSSDSATGRPRKLRSPCVVVMYARTLLSPPSSFKALLSPSMAEPQPPELRPASPSTLATSVASSAGELPHPSSFEGMREEENREEMSMPIAADSLSDRRSGKKAASPADNRSVMEDLRGMAGVSVASTSFESGWLIVSACAVIISGRVSCGGRDAAIELDAWLRDPLASWFGA
eukprot:scaffold257973_cov31-Tisochrysis_lutea.AAC.2